MVFGSMPAIMRYRDSAVMRATFAVPSAVSRFSSDVCNWLWVESYPSTPSLRCRSIICCCERSTSTFSSSNWLESHLETMSVWWTGVW